MEDRQARVPWATCTAHDDCNGLQITDDSRCLRHCNHHEREFAITKIRDGADLNVLRGVTIDAQLLGQVLSAVVDEHGVVRLRNAGFEGATFEGDVWYSGARFEEYIFEGYAGFEHATFKGNALFENATFKANARFDNAIFERDAWFFGGTSFEGDALFENATFKANARFDNATFKGSASFENATFKGSASFENATFKGFAFFDNATFKANAGFDNATFEKPISYRDATFEGFALFENATFKANARFDNATFKADAQFDTATFEGDARFNNARFEKARSIGHVLCAKTLTLDRVEFGAPVTLTASAARVSMRGSFFASSATIQLRHAAVIVGAYFNAKSVITWHPEGHPREGQFWSSQDDAQSWPKLRSLVRTDVAPLVIGDVDLETCRFSTAHNLDLLVLRSTATLPPAPRMRARRRVIAEERIWRMQSHRRAQRTWEATTTACTWTPEVSREPVLSPSRLAATYRFLRKSLEDQGDEPGAADFYYGEMEMRRLTSEAPRWERFILTLYWLLSGYGLRAWRALVPLVVAIAIFAALFNAFGFAAAEQRPVVDADKPAAISDEVDSSGSARRTNDLFALETWTTADGWLQSVGNATAVLRGPEAELTQWGEAFRISMRITGPVLIALAVLAIRGRIKR